MIDPNHPRLPIVRQCTLVAISRSTYYYASRGESSFNLQLMCRIDEQFLATPWYGSRQMARHLRRQGHGVGSKRVRRLMRLTAIYRKPSTSSPDWATRTVLSWRMSNTLRQQQPNVLDYLTLACHAAVRQQPAPSLLLPTHSVIQ